MEEKGKKNTLFFAILGLAVTLVLAGTATYAWFTSNNEAGTNTAYGKSGTASLKFLIGPDEGSMTEATTDGVEIAQVNKAQLDALFPVTTDDLDTFLYASQYSDKGAIGYSKDENEEKLYHGQIYIKLEGENISEDATYDLYLDKSDEAGGAMGENTGGGHVLNGSRLGLKFGLDDGDKIVIFKFDEENKGDHEINTYVGGQKIQAGQVLDKDGKPVTDPSVEFAGYTLDSSEGTVELPENSLATVKINETVPIDIYFYLEGCDEDCVQQISKHSCDIHLAFYAIASAE